MFGVPTLQYGAKMPNHRGENAKPLKNSYNAFSRHPMVGILVCTNVSYNIFYTSSTVFM